MHVSGSNCYEVTFTVSSCISNYNKYLGQILTDCLVTSPKERVEGAELAPILEP